MNGGGLIFWNSCDGQKNKYTSMATGDGDRSFYIRNKIKDWFCLNAEAPQALTGSGLVWWDSCIMSKNQFVALDSKGKPLNALPVADRAGDLLSGQTKE